MEQHPNGTFAPENSLSRFTYANFYRSRVSDFGSSITFRGSTPSLDCTYQKGKPKDPLFTLNN